MTESMVQLLRSISNIHDMENFTKIPSWNAFKDGLMNSPYSTTDIEAALSLKVEEIETIEFQVVVNDFIVELERLIDKSLPKNEEAFENAYSKLTGRADTIVQKFLEVSATEGSHVTVEDVIENDYPDIIKYTDSVYLPILISILEAKTQANQILKTY